MAEQARLLSEIQSLDIPLSQVYIINPNLASSGEPPQSNPGVGCTSDCPNLNTIAEHARTIARLQIDQVRLQLRELPLTMQIDQLKDALGQAEEMIASYEKEWERNHQSVKNLGGIVGTMLEGFKTVMNAPQLSHSNIVMELTKAFMKSKEEMDAWKAEEAASAEAFTTPKGIREGVPEAALEVAPGY